MNPLLRSYVQDASAFAAAHAAIALLCAVLWVRQIVRLKAERKTFRALQSDSSLRGPDFERTTVGGLVLYARQAGRVGHLLEQDAVGRHIERSLGREASALQTLVTAFVLVGLLGTLFNLWELGPSFWSGVIEGSLQPDQATIGVAFAASIFGIVWALLASFFHAFGIQPQQIGFASQAAAWICSDGLLHLAPNQQQAVEKAIGDLTRTCEGLLGDLRKEQAALTLQFVDQLQSSVAILDKRMEGIADEWQQALEGASTATSSSAGQMAAAASELSRTTTAVGVVLQDTAGTLASYKHLGDLIDEVRSRSDALVTEVTGRLEAFTLQTEAALARLNEGQLRAMESQAELANGRLSDLMDGWHTKSAATLLQFSQSITNASTSMSTAWAAQAEGLASGLGRHLADWTKILTVPAQELHAATSLVNSQLVTTAALIKELQQSDNRLKMDSTDGKILIDIRDRLSRFAPGPPDNAAAQRHTQLLEHLARLPEGIGRELRQTRPAVVNEPQRTQHSPPPAPVAPPQSARTRDAQQGHSGSSTSHVAATPSLNVKASWWRRLFS